MDKLISIGKITNFHGVNGEVKVGYTLGKENQLAEIKEMLVLKNNKHIKLTVESIRFHKKFALIKFKELSSVNEVTELKGSFLLVEKESLKGFLEEDEFYIDDLVGLKAYTVGGELIGSIAFVAAQGGGDIITIHDDEKNEFLVPFVKELVPEVDMKQGKIIINNIPGLIEKPEKK